MPLIPPLTYAGQTPTRVLHEILGLGYVPPARHLAESLRLRVEHVERALVELEDDDWLTRTDQHGHAETQINRDRSGFSTYTQWIYLEHGVKTAPPPDRFPFRALTRTTTPTQFEPTPDDAKVTAREMRALRVRLLEALAQTPAWEALMQDVYARDHNERACDLIHFLDDGWPDLREAVALLDATEDRPGRAQVWGKALAAVGRALDDIQERVDRLTRSYDRARDLHEGVRRWSSEGGALPTLTHTWPSPAQAITAANHVVALREGWLERGIDYWHGGTPYTTDVGSVGEIVIAAELVRFGQRLRHIAQTAAASNQATPAGLEFREVELPELVRRYPPQVHDRHPWLPMPDGVDVTIGPDDLRAGDYLLMVDGRLLHGPVLVLSSPTGQLGEFTAIIEPMDVATDAPVWLGWAVAFRRKQLVVRRQHAGDVDGEQSAASSEGGERIARVRRADDQDQDQELDKKPTLQERIAASAEALREAQRRKPPTVLEREYRYAPGAPTRGLRNH